MTAKKKYCTIFDKMKICAFSFKKTERYEIFCFCFL